MPQVPPEKPYWNLFALELKNILNQHGMDLGQLDDRMEIHREKVRRLSQSLKAPSSLPTLNPEEMKMVQDTLQLNQEEMVRLRAALLTTSIQRMLSDRISEDDARLAAEQILPTIKQALIKYKDKRGLGATRDIDPAEDMGPYIALDAALEAVEGGDNALHLSADTRSYMERVKQAQQACDYYNDAIDELNSSSRTIQKHPVWQHLWNEAKKGLERVDHRLQELGQEGCHEKRRG